jgi:hypothetical protein
VRTAEQAAHAAADREHAPYALAYLRHLAGERETTPDLGHWRVTPEQAAEVRARVEALVLAAAEAAGRRRAEVPAYTSEDGAQLREGDAAFNYYDHKPGRIGAASACDAGWFTFHHEDGTRALLNGQRVCSTAYAARRGWLLAAG